MWRLHADAERVRTLRRRHGSGLGLIVVHSAAQQASSSGVHGLLSLWTLVALTLGLGLWVLYGALRHDWVLACANMVGAGLTGVVLVCKIRDLTALN